MNFNRIKEEDRRRFFRQAFDDKYEFKYSMDKLLEKFGLVYIDYLIDSWYCYQEFTKICVEQNIKKECEWFDEEEWRKINGQVTIDFFQNKIIPEYNKRYANEI